MISPTMTIDQMAAYKYLVVLRLMLYFFQRGVVAIEPEITCTKDILGEGESLECNCTVKSAPGSSIPTPAPSLSWPGHSTTSTLRVDNVQRGNNGTVFTCLMEGQGTESKTVNHTLLVACGPSQDKLKIKCDGDPFITDGSSKMVLTIEASDVYPGAYFGWGGLCVSNQNNCSFQPQPDQDGEQVRCSVTNQVTYLSETVSYTVKLNYPPPEAPKIVVNTNKTELSSGDTLTCTVHGGKPLVQSVHFACTNPTLPDQQDQVEGNSVSSSITVDTTHATETPTTCDCSATWAKNETLYRKYAREKIRLEASPGQTQTQENSEDRPAVDGLEGYLLAAVVVPVLFVVIVAVFVVSFIIAKRRAQRKCILCCGQVDNHSHEQKTKCDISKICEVLEVYCNFQRNRGDNPNQDGQFSSVDLDQNIAYVNVDERPKNREKTVEENTPKQPTPRPNEDEGKEPTKPVRTVGGPTLKQSKLPAKQEPKTEKHGGEQVVVRKNGQADPDCAGPKADQDCKNLGANSGPHGEENPGFSLAWETREDPV